MVSLFLHIAVCLSLRMYINIFMTGPVSFPSPPYPRPPYPHPLCLSLFSTQPNQPLLCLSVCTFPTHTHTSPHLTHTCISALHTCLVPGQTWGTFTLVLLATQFHHNSCLVSPLLYSLTCTPVNSSQLTYLHMCPPTFYTVHLHICIPVKSY